MKFVVAGLFATEIALSPASFDPVTSERHRTPEEHRSVDGVDELDERSRRCGTDGKLRMLDISYP
jgi:hypothetical protein